MMEITFHEFFGRDKFVVFRRGIAYEVQLFDGGEYHEDVAVRHGGNDGGYDGDAPAFVGAGRCGCFCDSPEKVEWGSDSCLDRFGTYLKLAEPEAAEVLKAIKDYISVDA